MTRGNGSIKVKTFLTQRVKGSMGVWECGSNCNINVKGDFNTEDTEVTEEIQNILEGKVKNGSSRIRSDNI